MTRDYEQFPDDDNGNVLWQMHEDGDDLQSHMRLKYSIAFTTQEQAEKCALYLLAEEQNFHYFKMKNLMPFEWIITIYVYMEPEYSDIVDLEQWFTKIAEEHWVNTMVGAVWLTSTMMKTKTITKIKSVI